MFKAKHVFVHITIWLHNLGEFSMSFTDYPLASEAYAEDVVFFRIVCKVQINVEEWGLSTAFSLQLILQRKLDWQTLSLYVVTKRCPIAKRSPLTQRATIVKKQKWQSFLVSKDNISQKSLLKNRSDEHFLYKKRWYYSERK